MVQLSTFRVLFVLSESLLVNSREGIRNRNTDDQGVRVSQDLRKNCHSERSEEYISFGFQPQDDRKCVSPVSMGFHVQCSIELSLEIDKAKYYAQILTK